jgi:DNA-directed RNA polymerase subunit M/transcription elongation factor TFIIS
MAYYTALSRSASAAGTIILQGFDPSKITRGCSGYLRQEFRELEILDDITRLRFENDLPDTIQGNFRNSLIRSYQNCKGTSYIPEKTDTLLRWSANDPMKLLEEVTNIEWPIDKSKKQLGVKPVTSYIPAKGSKPVVSKSIAKHVISESEEEPESSPARKKQKKSNVAKVPNSSNPSKSSKHSLSDNDKDISPAKKKGKTSHTPTGSMASPLGLVWDNLDYSCAYDSFFGILYNIWVLDPVKWSETFNSINENYIGILSDGFQLVLEGHVSLEDIRDTVRYQLHGLDAQRFPMGQIGASVGDLASTMLESDRTISESQRVCSECEYTEDKANHHLTHVVSYSNGNKPVSTSGWISDLQTSTKRTCPDCLSVMIKKINYMELPKLLVFEYPNSNINTSHEIRVEVNNQTAVLHLRGIVYHGENHFTSRVISPEGKIWYHDGITTGSTCDSDIDLKNTTDANLETCQRKKLVFPVYAQN